MAKSLGISKKTSLIIACSVALIIFIASFFLNSFLEDVAKEYVGNELARINKSLKYKLEIDDIELNIFKGNLTFVDIIAHPTEDYLQQFNNGEADEKVLKGLTVSEADIKGISLFNFLWDKDLDIRDILVDKLVFNIYRPGKEFKVEGIEESKSSFSLDSIRLPGFSSVSLSQITVENYHLSIINYAIQDTISSYQGEELIFSGLALKPTTKEDPFFAIDDSRLELDLKNQVYNLKGGLYFTSFDGLHFSTETGHLEIKNYGLKPLVSKEVFSSKNHYTYEMYDVEVADFNIYGVQTHALITTGAISVDSISVNGMKFSIYKDKTKPFNTNLHKLLPNEQLKKLNQPMHIKHLTVSDSDLEYKELLPKGEKMLELELNKITARLDYITSIRDSIATDNSLEANLTASLQGQIPLEVNLSMPYNSESNSFSFSGNTKEASSFRELNGIVSPALGIRFTGGRLNGMDFSGSGTPHSIIGDLALYYSDLEIEVENKKDKEQKSVNWLANSVVKSSNPNKHGKLIVGSMEYERVYYKGIGNYLWKSVQTGIINSFNPVGKRKKRKK